MAPQIKKAVIPAAGLGTRFLPATKVVPKELLPIVDTPGIHYIVEEALQAGVEEIIFVISQDKKQILDYFNPSKELEAHLKSRNQMDYLESITKLNGKAKYTTVYQDQPLGLGHAVNCAKKAVGDEWFFVFLPDDLVDHEVPCAVQMHKLWQVHQKPMVAVAEVPWDQVHRYGVLKAMPISANLGKIEQLVEKPQRDAAPSNLAIIGRYLLPPSIFTYLQEVKQGAIGEIQLTDALIKLVESKELYSYQFEGDRFDIGNKLGFLEANIHYALKRADIKEKALELIRLIADSR